MTKKALLECMNGKACRKVYKGFLMEEDNERLKQSIIESLPANGKTIDDFVEDEGTYSVKGFSCFWRKSTLKNNEVGVLKISGNGKTYEFNGVRGEIPTGENFIPLKDEIGFTMHMGKRSITFILQEQ